MYSLWNDTSLCPGNIEQKFNSACICIAYGTTPVYGLVILNIYLTALAHLVYSLWNDTSLCPGNIEHILNSACICIAYGTTPIRVLVILNINLTALAYV